jgi:hypothetical protein
VPRSGQTGSNFGASHTHVTPYLRVIGEDTLLSDGVALTTASFSSTSFTTGETSIGSHNRHNIATMAIYLFLNWVRLYITFLLGFTTVDLYQPYGIWALATGTVVAAVFNFFWSVVIERTATGFRRLQPQFCSIYEPYLRVGDHGCRRTRWKTAWSSRTTSPSAPASRSAPRRSPTSGRAGRVSALRGSGHRGGGAPCRLRRPQPGTTSRAAVASFPSAVVPVRPAAILPAVADVPRAVPRCRESLVSDLYKRLLAVIESMSVQLRASV